MPGQRPGPCPRPFPLSQDTGWDTEGTRGRIQGPRALGSVLEPRCTCTDHTATQHPQGSRAHTGTGTHVGTRAHASCPPGPSRADLSEPSKPATSREGQRVTRVYHWPPCPVPGCVASRLRGPQGWLRPGPGVLGTALFTAGGCPPAPRPREVTNLQGHAYFTKQTACTLASEHAPASTSRHRRARGTCGNGEAMTGTGDITPSRHKGLRKGAHSGFPEE